MAWLLSVLLLLITPMAGFCAENQLGIGYGKEFRGNTDLEQVELFWRYQLPYSKTFADNSHLLLLLEVAGAALQERDSRTNDDTTLRFSLMPQAVYVPSSRLRMLAGFGAGFMHGNTEFDDHNLGGAFLLLSKLGLQFFVTDWCSIEYDYFHQSNAGIYDKNDSLNMNYISLSFSF